MIKPWILAAAAVMGAIVLFAGVPLTTWSKALVAKGVAWAKVVLWLLPAGTLTTFLVAAWRGLARLASDPTHAGVGAAVRSEAVELTVRWGAWGIGLTIGLCVVLLAIGQLLARKGEAA